MKTGIELITEERKRQIDVEGWTSEHDDLHVDEELATAAVSYALPNEAISYINENWGNDMHLTFWPFNLKWYKKDETDKTECRIKDLVKAGALIAAEIDRLQRLNKTNLKKN